MKNIKIKHGSCSGYDEWMHKEYGSYEDSDYSSDHVYSILEKEQDGNYMEVTKKEAETLLISISYHANGNAWSEASVSDKSCWMGYKRRIEKAIKHRTT